jgi:quinolinate synthase
MFRISPQHLCWALENLVEGNVVNRIKVEEDVKHWARVALDRMLEINVDQVPTKATMIAAGGILHD